MKLRRTLPLGLALVLFMGGCWTDYAQVAGPEAVSSASSTGSSPVPSTDNVFAVGSGIVEVFVNGAPLGKATTEGALVSGTSALVPGSENLIALRATRGQASLPSVYAEVSGAFGKAGSSKQWKAKVATDAEASGTMEAIASLDYDDSTWSKATDVGMSPPSVFPTASPAAGIWSDGAGDATVLFRLKLYVPSGYTTSRPRGFGGLVTGGAGGDEVTVSTIAELAAALCSTRSGSTCTDTTPRIIHVPSQLFDFTGTEGTITTTGCYVQQCSSGESELITDVLGGCNGKTTFDVTLDSAGLAPLLVGSNKTVLGTGPGAVIKGKGLRLGGGVSNIILRNITFASINPQTVWGGDAITLDNADNVWIDHNRFSLIGRHMLVTGFGKSPNVTVSWNEFDGATPYSATCNGSHYWVMLLTGAGGMTIENNWIHDTSGNGPQVGGAEGSAVTMHLVNNYYTHVPGHAIDPKSYSSLSMGAVTDTWATQMLLEGNVFLDVDTPITIGKMTTTATYSYGPGFAFAPLASTLSNTTSACQPALDRDCTENLANPESGTFPLDAQAVDAFSSVSSSFKMAPYPAGEVPNVVPHLAGPGHL